MAQIFKAKTLVSSTGRFSHEATAPNLVYNTGDQIISGNKFFVDNINVSGSGIFNALDLNNIDTLTISGVDISIINGEVNLTNRPTVNGTGVLLSGEAASLPTTIVYTTGDQTISGLKDFTTRPTVNTTPVLLSGEKAAGLNLLVKNDESFTVYKGQPVYINGAAGNNILIKLARNTGENTSSKTLGLLSQDLAPNGQGYITTEGQLEGIDTDAGNAGDPIWLGPTGNLIFGTGNKPYGINHLVYLGVVERKQSNNGKIYVKVQNGFELEELHNVDINHRYPLINDDVLRYDSNSGVWYNRPINTGTFQTQIDSLSGTLTSDYVTKLSGQFTNTPTVNGTNVLLSGDAIISGDLTGYLPHPTISKLQGYKVDLSATPAAGQVLEWNGTSWVAGTISAGGGGGGGRFYYFNFLNTSGIEPTGGLPTGNFQVSLLGRNYDVGSGSATSQDLDPEGTDILIAGFVTASGDAGITNIPAGLWDFNIWASVNSANATQSSILAKVNIYNPTNSTYRFVSQSDRVYLYDKDTIAQYILNVTIPQTGILATERIYVEIYGSKYTASSRQITMYFDSYRPSHVHTTIPSVLGNGVVKVIDGVFQSPATGIFDNDVDNNANINQSKIANLSSDLNDIRSTGIALNNKINSLSGTLTSDYLTVSSASSTYATITNLGITGSTLATNLASTGNTLATNLASTGSTLQTNINTLTTNLATTGSTLNTKINNLSGYINSQNSNIVFTTGDQSISGIKTFNNDVVFTGTAIFNEIDLSDTDNILLSGVNIQIASGSITLTNMPTISGNPLITGVDLSSYLTSSTASATYATITNLALTGSTLTTNLASTGSTLSTNLASTGSTLASNLATTGSTLSTNLASTGSTLSTNLASTGSTLASNLATTGSTLSTNLASTGSTLSTNLNTTGATLSNKIDSLSGSSVLLYGDQSIGGVKTFRDNVYINNLFVTGTETIVSTNNFNVQSPYLLLNLTGGAVDGGIFFVTGSGLTGVNDTGPIIGFDHSTKFKFGFSTRNSDLSTLPDIASVQDIQAYSGVADGKFATITNLASTGSTLDTKINNLSGVSVLTFGNQNIGGNKTFTGVTTFSGQEVNLVDIALNLSGVGDMTFSGTNINFINSPVFISGTNLRVVGDVLGNNLVYNTGNQTISGNKTFAEDTTFGDPGQGDFLVISGNSFTVYGSGNFTSGLFVNGTGVLLSGQATQVDLGSTVRTTGNQTVSGVKNFQSALLVSGKEVYFQKDIVYSSGISFTPDYISGRNFVYQLTGFATTYNTINNPINVPEGETILIKVAQSNYGNNFLNFGNNYRFPADASPLITQGSGKFDIFNILKLDDRFITTYIKNFSN